ncbi:Multidrug efflux pump subunit AcrB [Desulfonatronum thiosulfatophilum]|uniref:Multidrug efflux pump subunit AcrB n=1 Tax=Desulfonatronum thiosulfatophilum TaxID=617002 RepID=A0A1G6E474_9BACT|nr:efflux RND transporter permease subunit [Desulfonatronum thiosulfatophilum]SDB52264.1 Multidrug efflux pump subunit AcrB [Desulfonatronum thiosulfatophilum]
MEKLGLAGWIADRLLDSPLVPLFVISCLILGGYGLLVTPREDRPDIDVPTAMVIIPWPGGGTERVDDQLARQAGSWVRRLATVTEVRSSSTDHAALLAVEFEAGTAEATAFAKLQEVFSANAELLPVDAGPVVIETFGEQRLVMFIATLSSRSRSPRELELIAGEFAARLEPVAGVRSITRHGGEARAVEVLPRPEDMAARGIRFHQLEEAFAGLAGQLPAGTLEDAPVTRVQSGANLSDRRVLARIPVGEGDFGPVHLEDVADIRDGVALRKEAVLYWHRDQAEAHPAVTLGVTTLAGRNVSDVTQRVLERMEELRLELLPDDVRLTAGYDAGKDATERVRRVLRQLLTGTLVVVGIIWIGLGWRAAVIIAMMMPSSLAIVPYVYNRFDFTLNPVSIAAMILAIGILSDDAVVMLENISRQFRNAGEKSRELTVRAVNEVGNPTILADLLVVATLLPTAYITGEMGQYIRAIPVGASVAVMFSLLIALSITPYFGLRLLKVDRSANNGNQENGHREGQRYTRIYRAVIGPFLARGLLRWILYLILVVLLLASISMVWFRLVQVGLTPLLDRQIFVVHVELPAGSTLTDTLAATSALGGHLRELEEVQSLTIYAGLDGPLIYPPAEIPVPQDTPPHLAAVHVEMVPQEERERQSYEVGREVAGRLGDWLKPYNAFGYIGRIPSGPSNDRDITVEIYGPDAEARQVLAERVVRALSRQPGVVGIEQIPRSPLDVLNLEIDPQRAAAHGVAPGEITRTLRMAVDGRHVADLPGIVSRDPVPIILRLDEHRRGNPDALRALHVPSRTGASAPLEELVEFRFQAGDPVRYRRDQLPVITIVADLDRSIAQAVTVQQDVQDDLRREYGEEAIPVRWLSLPEDTAHSSLYWAGEWEMTRDVYIDLGAAGAVVMLIIYVLLAGWFGSYGLPFLIMMPIPLIFIGVMPAHWIWGIDIAGTGILGVIALAGIVARNSILLVDFIRKREQEGMELRKAVIQAGAQRTRPIILTAATVMFGSGVLIFEPSLEPLGLTLASGVLISVPLTLLLIPVLYFHTHPPKDQ